MSATTYSIDIINNYGPPQQYFLFSKAPEVTPNDGNAVVFQNALANVLVQPKGTGEFAFNKSFSAICGYTTGTLKAGMVISSYQPVDVKLSTAKNGSDVPMIGVGAPNPGASFDTGAIKADCETDGSFIIKCDHGFTIADNLFIGLGTIDAIKGTTIPSSVFTAEPNKNSTITPHVTYYLATGTRKVGSIIDVTTISNPAVVDFTGKAQVNAVVTHNADGTFDVKFVNTQ